jgi:HAMP domain-containing protein
VTTTGEPTIGQDSRQLDRSGRRSRRWTARAVLVRMFVAVAVIAVVVVGVVNFLGARSIFSETMEAELASISSDRAGSVRAEIDRARTDVMALARDTSVVLATRDFTAAFVEVNGAQGALDPSQEQELEQFYASGGEVLGESGGSALVPAGSVAQYLQYHYIVDNPFAADERKDLVDAEDGSSYSSAHAAYHPMLVERARIMGAADLLLIGKDTEDSIVYSVDKQIDFGTSLAVGPYSATALAAAVTDQLTSVPVGEAIIVDFEPYAPHGYLPTMFVAAAITDQTEVVGSVVVALPRGLLDDVTTFGGRWSDIFEADSGEVYLVGPDLLMRTNSRFWIEDPASYVKALATAGYPDDVGELIVQYDSTVLSQPVDTDAVAGALDGEHYLDEGKNYLDDKTLTSAELLQLPGVDWVIVAEISASQANAFAVDYIWSLVILALITIPIAAIVAYVFARGLTQPVVPLTETSDAIAKGDVGAQVPDLGRNEYGDLGNRINTISAQIRASDAQREERNREIMQVLFAALPPRLVDDARAAIEDGTIATTPGFGDLTDTCTVIAVSVSGYFDLAGSDMEFVVDVSSSFARSVEDLAGGHGIERVRSTPDEYVFTAGLRTEGFATMDAVRFVDGLIDLLDELQKDTSRTGEYRVSLSAGHVASGVLRGSEITFGIWGPPVRRALSLVADAHAYQVLVDRTVKDELDGAWNLEPVDVVTHDDEDPDVYLVTSR